MVEVPWERQHRGSLHYLCGALLASTFRAMHWKEQWRRTEAAPVMFAVLATAMVVNGAERSELEAALKTVRAVAREGSGNSDAAAAWRVLATGHPADLPLLLAGMDSAGPLAANWIRAAVDKVAATGTAQAALLPVPELSEFLLDLRHDPAARRLAYELLTRAQPDVTPRLLPGFLNDPSLELRRDAVQRLTGDGIALQTTGNGTGAALLLRQALGFARDADQIEALAKQLRELGQPVDLAELFGFLREWRVIGPFDNTGRTGFVTPFPPESSLNFDAELAGKLGQVRWTNLVTTNELGILDINRAYGELKEVTAYAYTEFIADQPQPAEVRIGCKNGWKVWFNGQLLFGRDEYHAGAEIDQYRLPVQLAAGRNTLLVKVCQNEQKEDWTREWEFQLRICDSLGTPIRPAPASPTLLSTAAASRPQ